jgi:DNA-binding LacI/PurR family transcriptional regulator
MIEYYRKASLITRPDLLREVSTSPRLGRPVSKRMDIVQYLRERIVTGELRAGDRIPNRVEIGARFDASPLTVQSALDDLIKWGFVVARGRHGTFVESHPPHLFRYGLAMPTRSSTEPWSRFWQALERAAAQISANHETDGTWVEVSHDVDARRNVEAIRMDAESAEQRLAGIVFAVHPGLIADSSTVHDTKIPRVAILPESTFKGMRLVYPDWLALIDQGLDMFVRAGRRRVAFLTTWSPSLAHDLFEHIETSAQQRSLPLDRHLIHHVPFSDPQWARSIIHTLALLPPEKRPDGLFILDDHLVEAASAALRETKLAPSPQFSVLGHCNIPLLPQSEVPITFIGFDIPLMLRECLVIIDRLRLSQKVPTKTVLCPPILVSPS